MVPAPISSVRIRDSYFNSDDVDNDTAADAESGPVTRWVTPELAISRGIRIVDSHTALAHLGKFVDFIERHIVPHWRRAAGTSQRKFRFSDLWTAFQPGELLHVPVSSNSPQNLQVDAAQASGPRMYQTAWRLYSMVCKSFRDGKPDDTHEQAGRDLAGL